MTPRIPTPKPTRAQYARAKISEIVGAASHGDIIETSDVACVINQWYRGFGNRGIGCLLREREDIEWISPGMWRVL